MSQLQYIRKCTLVIDNEKGKGLDLSGLRITFKVKKSDAQTPNTAEIRVYNITQDLANRIRKEFKRITLQAGYESNYGVIFKGNIKQCRIGRENGTDTYIDIAAGDGDSAYNYGVVNATLSAGAKNTDQLNAAIGAMSSNGVSKGYVGDLGGQALARGKVMYGMARDYLRQTSESADATWSIQDGKLQVINKTQVLPNQAVLLTSKTGLIGMPEQTNEGIKAKCLLNPMLKIGVKVKINQKDIQEAQLENTDKNAPVNKPASIKADGIYRLLVVEHSGDTRGTEWYSDLVCLDIYAANPDKKKVSKK